MFNLAKRDLVGISKVSLYLRSEWIGAYFQRRDILASRHMLAMVEVGSRKLCRSLLTVERRGSLIQTKMRPMRSRVR